MAQRAKKYGLYQPFSFFFPLTPHLFSLWTNKQMVKKKNIIFLREESLKKKINRAVQQIITLISEDYFTRRLIAGRVNISI